MANVIANYTFNKDKSMVIFDNKYHIVARHLLKIRDIPKGIQVYDNDNFVGNYGRLYFKSKGIRFGYFLFKYTFYIFSITKIWEKICI